MYIYVWRYVYVAFWIELINFKMSSVLEPIIAPIKRKKFALAEQDLPATTYNMELVSLVLMHIVIRAKYFFLIEFQLFPISYGWFYACLVIFILITVQFGKYLLFIVNFVVVVCFHLF